MKKYQLVYAPLNDDNIIVGYEDTFNALNYMANEWYFAGNEGSFLYYTKFDDYYINPKPFIIDHNAFTLRHFIQKFYYNKNNAIFPIRVDSSNIVNIFTYGDLPKSFLDRKVEKINYDSNCDNFEIIISRY